MPENVFLLNSFLFLTTTKTFLSLFVCVDIRVKTDIKICEALLFVLLKAQSEPKSFRRKTLVFRLGKFIVPTTENGEELNIRANFSFFVFFSDLADDCKAIIRIRFTDNSNRNFNSN